MTQEQPDPLTLDPRWHVDCRIEAELPEDKVIGKRFIIHAAFVAAALSAVTYTGWLGFVTLNLRHQIADQVVIPITAPFGRQHIVLPIPTKGIACAHGAHGHHH